MTCVYVPGETFLLWSILFSPRGLLLERTYSLALWQWYCILHYTSDTWSLLFHSSTFEWGATLHLWHILVSLSLDTWNLGITFISSPTCEWDATLAFVAHLASLNLRYQTVNSYLSPVCYLHFMSHLPHPSVASNPKLNNTLWRKTTFNNTRDVGENSPVSVTIATWVWARLAVGRILLVFLIYVLWRIYLLIDGRLHFRYAVTTAYSSVFSHFAITQCNPFEVQKYYLFSVSARLHVSALGQMQCLVAALLGYSAVPPSSLCPLILFHDAMILLICALRQVLREVRINSSH